MRNFHKAGFDYPDAATMYRAYETDLYRFDQLYRRFCEAADSAEEKAGTSSSRCGPRSRLITATAI